MTFKKMEKRIGGNRRPQTFRDCKKCGIRFGPLPRLSVQFCSKKCGYAFRKGKPSAKKGKKYPHLQRARIGNCEICKKEYRATGDWKQRKQKFCSKKCFHKYWKKEIRPKIKAGPKKGEKNQAWRGDDVGYSGLHKWVASKLGRPKKCDHCGSIKEKKYEWANVDHQYRRNLEDWMRLCTQCHRKYDYTHNLVQPF